MSQTNDVSAFPSHGSMGEVVQQGMTLRAYFAGQALAGLLAGGKSIFEWDETSRCALKHADALINALSSREPSGEVGRG